MDTETDLLELARRLELTPKESPRWLQAHVAWLSGLTLFGLVSIRIFLVANFDSTTAYGLIESAGPAQVAFAVLVDNVQNLFGFLTTAIAGCAVLYAERRSLRLAGLTLAALIGLISLLFLSWFNAIALVLFFLFILFIASRPMIAKFSLKLKKEEPNKPKSGGSLPGEPHAFLEGQNLEVLWDLMAQEVKLLNGQRAKEASKLEAMIQEEAPPEEIVTQSSTNNTLVWRSHALLHQMKRLNEEIARKRRLGRNELTFGGLVGFVVYFSVVFLLPFLLDRSVWLPAEKLALGGEEIVGYVIGDSEGWITVLTHADRQLIRIPSDRVTNRALCAASAQIRPPTLAEKLDGRRPKHAYELCSNSSAHKPTAPEKGAAVTHASPAKA